MEPWVLIVEDESDFRELLVTVLQQEGFRVEDAANGQEALELLERSPRLPCLVIMDLSMPVMHGWELFERLRKDPRWRGINVVVLSSAPRGTMPSGVPVLYKPVELASLLGIVRTCCPISAQHP